MPDLPVNVITTQGVKLLDLSEDERSVAASHRQAALLYRDSGDADRLGSFSGVTVGGMELETDPREVERLANQGQLDFEDFYEDG
jgi:hypothetical protein